MDAQIEQFRAALMESQQIDTGVHIGYRALSVLTAIAECDDAGAADSRFGVSTRKPKSLGAARLRATTLHRGLVDAPGCEPGHER